jgi:hypothetical protein
MAKLGNQNARTHGLTARNQNLSQEDAASLEQHVNECLDHYQPKGPIEHRLVKQIATCQWRLHRIAEADIAAGYDQNLADNPKLIRQIDFLGRHEARLHRMARDARKELTTLQDRRFEQEDAWQSYEAEKEAHEAELRRAEAFQAHAMELASRRSGLKPQPSPPATSTQAPASPPSATTPPTATPSSQPAPMSDFDARIEAAIAQSYAAIGLTLDDFYRHEQFFAAQEKCENETNEASKVE